MSCPGCWTSTSLGLQLKKLNVELTELTTNRPPTSTSPGKEGKSLQVRPLPLLIDFPGRQGAISLPPAESVSGKRFRSAFQRLGEDRCRNRQPSSPCSNCTDEAFSPATSSQIILSNNLPWSTHRNFSRNCLPTCLIASGEEWTKPQRPRKAGTARSPSSAVPSLVIRRSAERRIRRDRSPSIGRGSNPYPATSLMRCRENELASLSESNGRARPSLTHPTRSNWQRVFALRHDIAR